MTYSTAKVVKITDCRIKSMYIFLLVLVAMYAIFNVLGGNQYCEFVDLQSVHLDETFWWSTGGWADAVAPARERVESHQDSNIPYCNGTLNTDYWYTSSWRYIDNQCAFDLKSNHFTSKLTNGLRATTSMGVFDENEVQQKVLIVPAVEELKLTYGVIVNVRSILEAPKLSLELNGEYEDMPPCNEERTTRCVDNSHRIQFSLEELLAFNGIDMDDRNIGGEPHDSTPEGYLQEARPIYRLTGSKVKVAIEVSNYKFADPAKFWFMEFPKFDNQLKGRVKISGDKDDGTVTWSCLGWTMIEYSYETGGGTSSSRRRTSEESGKMPQVGSYYTCDMQVIFSVSGSVCFTSNKAIQDALIAVTVLFGIAGVLVDAVFSSLLKTFEIAKASDDVTEWANYQKAKKLKDKFDRGDMALVIENDQSMGMNSEGTVTLPNEQPGLRKKKSSKRGSRARQRSHTHPNVQSDSEEMEGEGGHWLGGGEHDEECPPQQPMKKKKSRSKKQQKWKQNVELSAKGGNKKKKKSHGP